MARVPRVNIQGVSFRLVGGLLPSLIEVCVLENRITIKEETPDHLVAYWLGMLNGLGISYNIDSECPLFRTMQGNRERIRDELKEARLRKREAFNKDHYRIIHRAGDSDSIKVSVRPVE